MKDELNIQRMKLIIRGAVQGVGFRPFIYNLANRYHLSGWVSNSSQGVFIEAEGSKSTLDQFLLRIEKEKPRHAYIQSIEASFLDACGYEKFEIRESNRHGDKSALVLPDIATCPECLAEIFDQANRRYLYPFTNCTHCGPRFSIIETLPYDRCNTTMKNFEMCQDCQREYDDPNDRRFHAQPNACPRCGPSLEYWSGGVLEYLHFEAMLKAADMIRSGKIVAVKGLGGFHLMVDARNEEAVARLRERKRREAKPLAVMFPLLEMLKHECELSELEERLVQSPESPIVLLRRRTNPQSAIRDSQSTLASSIAPQNPYLGAMLPYTPLHHILMRKLGFPVVATSGNLSDEPICIKNEEAFERLKDIADGFLVHNRPIVRHVDDSVVRVVLGREQVIRRARGYAPLPITVGRNVIPSRIAVGAHQKNAVAVSSHNNIFISQHIGDLETKEAFDAFTRVASDMQTLFDAKPKAIVADLHPDYLSTQFAEQSSLPLHQFQHHYAHVAACMAENELEGQLLGVSWDGTGYGLDGTIWGGEFLQTTDTAFRRVASFRPFRLPGSAKSVKEPRRTALGLLYEILGEDVFEMKFLQPVLAFSDEELSLLMQMLEKKVNSPVTSSVGRLFDAVASLINVRQRVSFEGQAAMELEFAIRNESNSVLYEYRIEGDLQSAIRDPQSPIQIDWSPTIVNIVHDWGIGESVATISQRFHNTLVETVVDVAKLVGDERVVLTGGCFQNKYLTERTVQRLQREGFRPYWHQRVPPNDGGIALGQIIAAARLMKADDEVNEKSKDEVQANHQHVMEVAS